MEKSQQDDLSMICLGASKWSKDQHKTLHKVIRLQRGGFLMIREASGTGKSGLLRLVCAYAPSMGMLVLAGAATHIATNTFAVQLRTLCQNPIFKGLGLAETLIVRLYPEFVNSAARNHLQNKLREIYLAEGKPVKKLEDMTPPVNAEVDEAEDQLGRQIIHAAERKVSTIFQALELSPIYQALLLARKYNEEARTVMKG